MFVARLTGPPTWGLLIVIMATVSFSAREALDEGKNVAVYLIAQDINDSVSDEDKVLIESALGEGEVIGAYRDFSLYKQIMPLHTPIGQIQLFLTLAFLRS